MAAAFQGAPVRSAVVGPAWRGDAFLTPSGSGPTNHLVLEDGLSALLLESGDTFTLE